MENQTAVRKRHSVCIVRMLSSSLDNAFAQYFPRLFLRWHSWLYILWSRGEGHSWWGSLWLLQFQQNVPPKVLPNKTTIKFISISAASRRMILVLKSSAVPTTPSVSTPSTCSDNLAEGLSARRGDAWPAVFLHSCCGLPAHPSCKFILRVSLALLSLLLSFLNHVIEISLLRSSQSLLRIEWCGMSILRHRILPAFCIAEQ